MVDPDRVHQRLALLAGYLRKLRRLHDLTLAEYLLHEVYAGRRRRLAGSARLR